MAVIQPAFSYPQDVTNILWEEITEADSASPVSRPGLETLSGSIQVVGTFGGATVVLQGSNDGTNWVTVGDLQGTAISLTAAGAAEFSSTFKYLRPSASGGSSQDIDVYMVLRQ